MYPRPAITAALALGTIICCIGIADAINAEIVPVGQDWQLLLLTDPLPWQAAEELCSKYGGHLVSIHNQTEEELVEQCCFERLGAPKCWIGLNDILDEGHFVFSDGTSKNYTAWYTASWTHKPWESEPNDRLKPWAQEDCVLLEHDHRGWHDEHCNDAYPFICRRPTPPPPPAPPAAAHQAAGQPATGNVTLEEPPTPEQAAAAAVAKHSPTSHLLLWGLLGGVVGGLLAFEAVYLMVLMYRKHSGSWSGWRPTFDAVRVVKQVEMTSAADDEDDDDFGVPDLVEAPPNWREVAGMRMRVVARAGWARVQGLFRRRYSELSQ